MSTEPLQQRPTVVTAVAVINMIFGFMGLMSACCMGAAIAAFPALADAQPAGGPNLFKELKDLFESIPGYVPFMIASVVVGLVTSVLLIVSGFGLWKLRNWARIFCLVYAVYLLLS